MGHIEHIYIAQQSRGEVTELEAAELEAGKGIVGDRYHSKAEALIEKGDLVPDNHLSLVDIAQLQNYLATHDADIPLGDFRRSLLCSGIDLNQLVGKKFKVGNAVCFGVELCEPCAFLAATVHRGVLPGLVEKAGLRATILESGSIEKGSSVDAL